MYRYLHSIIFYIPEGKYVIELKARRESRGSGSGKQPTLSGHCTLHRDTSQSATHYESKQPSLQKMKMCEPHVAVGCGHLLSFLLHSLTNNFSFTYSRRNKVTESNTISLFVIIEVWYHIYSFCFLIFNRLFHYTKSITIMVFKLLFCYFD